VGLGNTHRDNFEFYKKCGWRSIPGLVERFAYVKANGEEEGTETQDYEMFIYDTNNLLRDIIEGDRPVVIKVPFW